MSVRGYRKIIARIGAAFCIAIGLAGIAALTSFAQTQPSDFSLQVSPSPIVTTLKPGTQTTLEMRIRNAGTGTENLKIEPRKFAVDKKSGEVKLDDTGSPDIASWISYSAPKFTIKSGEWYTQKITITLPKDTGFSYSLALVISRTSDPKADSASTRLIKGSVAVFTLINVDRPGATRKLEIEKFSTSAGIYEYLPASVNINFKNVGNTIVQPYGNVFIQHGSGDKAPIATLPVNDKGGYILPGSERLLTTNWSDGFPRYDISKDADGNEKKTEVWDWSQLSHFRIGRYTAKLIAVYNDGQRDVPIEQEITFWVLPWKIMLGALVVVLVLGLGIWTVFRKLWSFVRRGKKRPSKSDA